MALLVNKTFEVERSFPLKLTAVFPLMMQLLMATLTSDNGMKIPPVVPALLPVNVELRIVSVEDCAMPNRMANPPPSPPLFAEFPENELFEINTLQFVGMPLRQTPPPSSYAVVSYDCTIFDAYRSVEV